MGSQGENEGERNIREGGKERGKNKGDDDGREKTDREGWEGKIEKADMQ